MKEIIEAIKKAKGLGKWVFICGNGGSASTANHFANDLVKMCGVKAMSLCANEAIVMAYANDLSYERVFSEQLKVFANRNDVLITISGSGTSKNILEAEDTAVDEGLFFYNFPTMSEENVDMQAIENLHMHWVHDIARELMK